MILKYTNISMLLIELKALKSFFSFIVVEEFSFYIMTIIMIISSNGFTLFFVLIILVFFSKDSFTEIVSYFIFEFHAKDFEQKLQNRLI